MLIGLLGDDEDSKMSEMQGAISSLARDDSECLQCQGILQLAIFASNKHDLMFADGELFNRILAIADSPTFEHLQFPMHFFDAVTRFPESYLVTFASPRFFSFLLTHFFGQDTELTGQVLLIWSNILNTSEFLANGLITSAWVLAIITRATADFDRLYLSFMEFLSGLLIRYRILTNLEIDVLSDICELIISLLQFKSESALSVALNCLRTVSAVTDTVFVMHFFTVEILGSVARCLLSQFSGARGDAIAVILNFSAISDFAREQLISAGFAELSFDGPGLDHDVLGHIADTAANFLSATPDLALQFLRSPMMESICSLLWQATFDVKVRICRALCLLGRASPEILLSMGLEWMEPMLDCLEGGDSGYVILAVEASLALIGHAERSLGDAVAVECREILRKTYSEGLADVLLHRDDLPDPVYEWIELVKARCRD
jgi:hypothetical protein